MDDARASAQPIVVTAALIERDGHLLLARRRVDAPRGGLWEFPGGKVEPGESEREALARELDEELGITVSVGQATDTVRWSYPEVTIELRAYACEIVGGEPALNDHDEIRWVARAHLTDYPLCEADVPIATRLSRQDV